MDALTANLAANLAEHARAQPERLAIVDYRHGRRRSLSYGELARRVAGLGAVLARRGLAPGRRALIFVPMSIELYVVLLGCVHAGATAVFLDAWAGRDRLRAAIELADPFAFIGIPRAHLLRLISPQVRRIPLKLWVGLPWAWPLEQAVVHAAPVPVAPAAPALITFTTGSTGPPKAAVRSHAFLWAQHQALRRHLGITANDIDLATLPIFVLNNLAVGATTVIPDFDPRRPAAIDPVAIDRQIRAEGVTTSAGSPAFYERLVRWAEDNGRTLPLRALFTGGAPVYPPLARRLAERIAGTAHVIYGSTEAEPIAGCALELPVPPQPDAEDGPGASRSALRVPWLEDGICAGMPVPEVALRILRPHDGPIALGDQGWAEWEAAPGTVGEIVVAGPHVLDGYLGDPEAVAANKIRDGERLWHRTGDGGRLDPQGRLWLLGRVRERVRRGNQIWWSTPAETRALQHPSVRHAAYLGCPDPDLGQRAVLCVELAGGALAPDEADRLRGLLAPMPVDEVRAFERIPRDPRHESKTNTEALRRLLASTLPHATPSRV